MRLAVLSTNPGGVWPWGASEELWAAAAAAALEEGHQVGVWVAATAAAAHPRTMTHRSATTSRA